ncbi:DUF2399 domain-containing protein [Streptomyces sp. NPDC001034]|uniref:DUF2399 domain-containing protein n=1 Tax=Streptomyces sp. NPDC001034 TaxID=3154375 RepID=UPI003316C314
MTVLDSTPVTCPEGLCHNGACRRTDLSPLLSPNVRWLWEQIAQRADQRGDAAMASGTMKIATPHSPTQRAAVIGLLSPRALPPGVTRRIDLDQLTQVLTRRDPDLTPGVVTAHALGRPLAARAADKARLTARLTTLQHLRSRLARALPTTAPVRPDDAGWDSLRRRGTLARLAQHPDPERLLRACFAVLHRLPAAGRADRRRLAHAATGNPHALDSGTDLACLVLAEAAAGGHTDTAGAARDAWDRLGVDLDTLTGGLLTLGVHPSGWRIPPEQPIVLTPHVLRHAKWPSPRHNERRWIFLTENPAVAAAALDEVKNPVRLLCTVGTPSRTELRALASLAARGWRIAVRADFDAAGLALVRAVLDAAPAAKAWRMTADDYNASLYPSPFEPGMLDFDRLGDTPWDPPLAAAMRVCGRPAYEEGLLGPLLTDLRQGYPSATTPVSGKRL